jgi:heptose-I-phosphate ethanolaminephosphotransferase
VNVSLITRSLSQKINVLRRSPGFLLGFGLIWVLFGLFINFQIFLGHPLAFFGAVPFFLFILLLYYDLRIPFRQILIIFYVIFPLLELDAYLVFQSMLTPWMVEIIYQSNFEEVFEFFTSHQGDTLVFCLWALVLVLGVKVLFGLKVGSSEVRQNWRWSFAPLLLVLLAGVPEIRVVYRQTQVHQSELDGYRKVAALRKTQLKVQAHTQAQSDEVHVVIIGESLNRNHMSLYHYSRKTTPNLDRRSDLFVFTDVISKYCRTDLVLENALVTHRNESGASYYDSPSILEVANSAGFQTYWLSNQLQFGFYDNKVSLISRAAKTRVFVNSSLGANITSENFDGKLNRILEKVIHVPSGNGPKIIFIHMMGSHFDYSKRYPPEFDHFRFQGAYDPITAGGLRILDPHYLDEYDNSVYYADFLINDIVEKIARLNKPSTVLFLSDHGEDIDQLSAHNEHNPKRGMFEIPFVFWASPSYRAIHPEIVQKVQRALHLSLQNDLLSQFIYLVTQIKIQGYPSPDSYFTSAQSMIPRWVTQKAIDYRLLRE